MISADVTGLAGFLQALTRRKRVEEAAQRSLEREAEKLVEAIREAAPEDSGDLRASVRAEPGDDKLSVVVVAGNDENTVKPSASGFELDVAIMTEYGTARSPGHPFFWPTVNAMRGELKANIDSDLKNEAE